MAIRQDVATYVAAGADESVQRVITSVHGLARKLKQWYDRQLADLDVSTGEWAVLSKLARDGGGEGPDARACSRTRRAWRRRR